MDTHTVEILGINFITYNEGQILEKIEKYVFQSQTSKVKSQNLDQQPLIIYTPNPEIAVFANKYPELKKVINTAQINIPDGAGIVWAARILNKPIKERITGIDLMEKMVKLAADKGLSIGLIGGYEKVALDSLECLKAKYPRLKGWGEEGPTINLQFSQPKADPPLAEIFNLQLDYNNWDIDEFIEKVRKTGTKILFVAMGCPKQELFIREISQQLNNIVIMSVGGSFDYISGKITRAPKWMRLLGLEWLFRLIREPRRFKRQLSLIRFIGMVSKEKLKRWTN